MDVVAAVVVQVVWSAGLQQQFHSPCMPHVVASRKAGYSWPAVTMVDVHDSCSEAVSNGYVIQLTVQCPSLLWSERTRGAGSQFSG